MPLTAVRRTTGEPFARLRDEWNGLLDRSTSRSVFLTWDWQYAWWEAFQVGRELFLIEVRGRAGELRGIAPFCIERRGGLAPERVVGFLATERVSSEYLDVIAAPGDEDAVVAAVWCELLTAKLEWDRIELTDLRADAIAGGLEPAARAGGFRVSRESCQDCPYVALPGNEEEFWQVLGPGTRASIRRKTRKLEGVGFSVRILEEAFDMERALERLFDLHAIRWAVRDRAGNFRDERVRRFHRRLVAAHAPRGRIRVGVIARGDETVAALYALQYKDVTSYYQSGFEPALPDPALKESDYSPGLVLIGQLMRDAAARGCHEFDFLRGWEAYKRRWTGASHQTWTLSLTQPGAWRCWLHQGLRRAKRATRQGAKSLLGRRGAIPTET